MDIQSQLKFVSVVVFLTEKEAFIHQAQETGISWQTLSWMEGQYTTPDL